MFFFQLRTSTIKMESITVGKRFFDRTVIEPFAGQQILLRHLLRSMAIASSAKRNAGEHEVLVLDDFKSEFERQRKRQKVLWSDASSASQVLLQAGGPEQYVQEIRAHMLSTLMEHMDKSNEEMIRMMNLNQELSKKLLELQCQYQQLLRTCFEKVRDLENSGYLAVAEDFFKTDADGTIGGKAKGKGQGGKTNSHPSGGITLLS